MFTLGALMASYRGVQGLDAAVIMVLSFLFADIYGLMKTNRGAKLLGSIVVAMLIIEINSMMQLGDFFAATAPYLVLLGYLVFHIARYNLLSRSLDERNTALSEQIDANHVFIEVGQNTSGLVHDLKNDLCRISYPRQHAQRQVRKLLEGAAPEYIAGLKRVAESLGEIKQAEDHLQHSLQVVRRIPAGFVRTDEHMVDVSTYIRDLSSFLMFRREFRHTVRISLHAADRAIWFGAESDLSAICKNIIENACQAAATAGESRLVQIRLYQHCHQDCGQQICSCSRSDGDLQLEVVNQGSIPWLSGEASLLDEEVFCIGRTSKQSGTGYGMVNVRRALRRIGGSGSIRVSDGYVITAIRFPQRLQQAKANSSRSARPGIRSAVDARKPRTQVAQ